MKRGIIKRALARRPDDSQKSFFFVKENKGEQILGRGIACAIETEVRGQRKFFLLTATDVKRDQVFAKSCRRPSWKLKKKRVKIQDSRFNIPRFQDSNFSFIPLDYEPRNRLKLVAEERLGDLIKSSWECRSFDITKTTFQTVD